MLALVVTVVPLVANAARRRVERDAGESPAFPPPGLHSPYRAAAAPPTDACQACLTVNAPPVAHPPRRPPPIGYTIDPKRVPDLLVFLRAHVPALVLLDVELSAEVSGGMLSIVAKYCHREERAFFTGSSTIGDVAHWAKGLEQSLSLVVTSLGEPKL